MTWLVQAFWNNAYSASDADSTQGAKGHEGN